MNPLVFAPLRRRGRGRPLAGADRGRLGRRGAAHAGQHDRSRRRSISFCMRCTTACRATGSRRSFRPAAILAADWVAGRAPAAAQASTAAIADAALGAAPLGARRHGARLSSQARPASLPLGAADPTARLEGFRELARDLDAARASRRRRYVLTQGYALTSLMTLLRRSGAPGRPAGAAHPLDLRAVAARMPVRRARPRARRSRPALRPDPQRCAFARSSRRGSCSGARPAGRSRPTNSTASPTLIAPVLDPPCPSARGRSRPALPALTKPASAIRPAGTPQPRGR